MWQIEQTVDSQYLINRNSKTSIRCTFLQILNLNVNGAEREKDVQKECDIGIYSIALDNAAPNNGSFLGFCKWWS